MCDNAQIKPWGQVQFSTEFGTNFTFESMRRVESGQYVGNETDIQKQCGTDYPQNQDTS